MKMRTQKDTEGTKKGHIERTKHKPHPVNEDEEDRQICQVLLSSRQTAGIFAKLFTNNSFGTILGTCQGAAVGCQKMQPKFQ